MPELPVVDEAERERIRAALKHYKKQHGNIGDPELHQRIMYALGLLDQDVPLSTLQRFLRNKVRTDDRMVRRYKKFLADVGGNGFAEKFVALIHEELTWPVFPPRWNILDFEGRYEFSLFDNEDHEARSGAIVMLPTTAPHVLSVWYEYRNDAAGEDADWGVVFGPRRGAFLQSSVDHFTLVTPYLSAVSFAGLALIDLDPVTLEGTGLETGYDPAQPPGSYRIRMVKVQGPKLRIEKTPRDVDPNMTFAEIESQSKKEG